MHKNKRKQKKVQEKSRWKQIIEWGIVIVIGSVLGVIIANWLNAQPFLQPQYAKPSELSFQNGIPLLIGYCMGLAILIICGYFLAKRLDNAVSENTSKPHQHEPLVQNDRQTGIR
jgi:uncharacterized membrane protein YfcA